MAPDGEEVINCCLPISTCVNMSNTIIRGLVRDVSDNIVLSNDTTRSRSEMVLNVSRPQWCEELVMATIRGDGSLDISQADMQFRSIEIYDKLH